jgi:two-component system, sensor histidine kinase and response regulator
MSTAGSRRTIGRAKGTLARLRRKAYAVTRALGGDADLAARVAGEVSDAGRRNASSDGCDMHVILEEGLHGSVLLIEIPPAASGALRYPLRQRATAEAFAEAAVALAAKSREELLDDLQESNQALQRTSIEAERASAAKAQFLANMSHEIRTPMNAIMGMNRLALATDPTPRQRGYLEKIESSTRHLLGIIDDVLDISKLEAGKLTLEVGPVALARVLDDVAGLIGSACHDKGLTLRIDVAPDVPGTVQGDALRLRQVLLNLVTNAVKFTDAGGVAIRVERLDGATDEVWLAFSVVDSGIGISPAERERLFTSFNQADATITRRFGGTGLGLAISKSLVELMGGAIDVTSRPGEGSTFRFTARFAPRDARGDARVLRIDLRGRRALVIDDPRASAALREMLTGMGIVVEECHSKAEGSARLGAARFDVAFVARSMLRTADGDFGSRAAARGTALFVIDEYRASGGEVVQGPEVAAVLRKPIDASALFDALAGWIDGVGAPHPGSVPAAPRAQPTFDATLRILLVEDNRLNQEVGVALLEELGLRATIAVDGREALMLLRRDESFDLVLMDVQMPVMDGLTATRAIRNDPRLRALPVIAMTANALATDREACLAAGMNAVVTKPIDPDDLARALATHLPQRPAAAKAGGLPRGIAGLDVERGLRFTRGKEDLYLRILRGFFEEQRDLPRELARRLVASDRVGAERLVHTVRGLASGLGAHALAAAAEAVEATLRAGAPDGEVAATAATLRRVHEELFGGLATSLAPDEGG